MNKNKLFMFLIGALLVTNIVLIFFLINGRGPHPGGPPPHRGEGPKNLIIERLHFDEKQVGEYDKLIQEHRKNINDQDLALMNLKNSLYKNLQAEENKTVTDSLINQMGTIQNKIEHIHYAHFEDIKKLCKPEQLKDFNELANELSQIFGPPHGPGGPPPHH
jgi:protein CpxP